MSEEKIFCGNGKIITTQYGEMTKISFSESDLKKMLANLENGWINTVLKKKKEPQEGKPTHYLEVDKWKPTEGATPVNAGASAIDPNVDLPFISHGFGLHWM